LINIAVSSNISTHEMRQLLHLNSSSFGSRFATQLVRALQREDEDEREAVVWLLTVLDDPQAIPQLQYLSLNQNLTRATRLAASLALAGMGATREMTATPRHMRLYAVR
jgi:HEAT repeat protein